MIYGLRRRDGSNAELGVLILNGCEGVGVKVGRSKSNFRARERNRKAFIDSDSNEKKKNCYNFCVCRYKLFERKRNVCVKVI